MVCVRDPAPAVDEDFQKPTMVPKDGERCFEDVIEDEVFRRAQELIAQRKQRETFYLVDLECVGERVKLWRQGLPGVELHYAVKANSDERLLSLLVGLGCGFDCASGWEIDTILRLGAKPQDIILANPCKDELLIEHAKHVGVSLMTFDCVEEAKKIAEIHPFAEVVLRLAVEETDARSPMGKKFGAPRKFWPDILKACRQLGLRLRGVSFHVGSGGCSIQVYRDSLLNARRVFDLVKASNMEPLDLLDIGGGFSMTAEDTVNNFDLAAPKIGALVAELFPLDRDLRVIGEAGRLICQSSHSVCTRISLARQLDDKRHYFLNSGVYQVFTNHIFESETFRGQPLLSKKELERRLQRLWKSYIWGQTCDGVDGIAKDKLMPHMEPGEWILYRNVGAYNQACASTFNGFATPDVFYI